MSTVSPNDAAGGSGSLVDSLLKIAVGGVSRAVDGQLAKQYPLTFFNENQVQNAYGELKPYSAPQANTRATSAAVGVLQSPAVLAIGGVALVAVLIIVVVKLAK